MQSAYMIGNRYQILDKIDEGGMGTVFKGLDTHSNESVAVKLLRPTVIANDPDMLERFQREGEALRELNHPNIVKMLDTIEDEGKHYLVMEYVSGGDLSDLLQQGQMPIQRILEIAIDLADALTRTHKLSIIHRDLKPANILIADDGTLRLTDFGIAHVTGKQHITETNAVMGTVPYMSPEILDGKSIDHRADIWAFGIILFEMLAVERPFTGDSPMAVIRSIVTDPIPDLEQLNPDCPIALIDLTYRMLEKDRNARIRSVRYVGAELEDILKGVEPSGHKPPVQSYETRRFDTPTPGYDDRPKHNLPAQTTPFVGREHEIDELSRLIDNPDVRLITVLAPGGMGKSRLALEIGRHYVEKRAVHEPPLQNAFENGVYFTELAPLSSADNIPSAIASATGYQFQPDQRPPKQQIIDYLTNKNMLLIMDNYEHLLDGAALMTAILQSAPNVTIVATSRQRLSQQAETLFHLSGMDFPEWETPDDALQYAAVKLFVNSAKRARPDFELTTDNMDFVARICKLVQGMPLGIVLAASWSGMLTAEEIAEELTQNLDFLETDETDLPERHRSMRAVIDYSWQQMTEAEQQVFMKLSVFRGGFTREAAQEVAGANLRVLMSLVNKSLIRRDIDSGRYEIHELLRQYAEATLVESGEMDFICDAHCKFFATKMESLKNDIAAGERQIETACEVDDDLDNVIFAWKWAQDQRHFQRIGQITDSLNSYIWLRGRQLLQIELYGETIPILQQFARTREDRIVKAQVLGYFVIAFTIINPMTERLEQSLIWAREALVIARETKDQQIIAWSTYVEGWALLATQRYDEALVSMETGIFLYRALNLMPELSRVLWGKAMVLHAMGARRSTAVAFYEQSLEVARQCDAHTIIADSSNNIGMMLLRLGKYHEGRKYIEEALVYRRKMGSTLVIPISLEGLAYCATALGDYTEARKYSEEALSIQREKGISGDDITRALFSSANIASLLGNHDEALVLLDECCRIVPYVEKSPNLLQLHGWLAFRRGDIDEANSNLQTAFDQIKETSDHIFVTRISLSLGVIEARRNNSQAASNLLLAGLKGAYDLEWISWIPKATYGFAVLLHHDGNKERAVELATFTHQNPASDHEFKTYAKNLLNDMLSEMEENLFDAAWEQGKQLDLDTVVQELLAEFGDETE